MSEKLYKNNVNLIPLGVRLWLSTKTPSREIGDGISMKLSPISRL